MIKKLGIIFLLVVAIAAYFGWDYYQKIYATMVPENLTEEYVYIPQGTTFAQLVDNLSGAGQIEDREAFSWLAGQMNYKKDEVRPGRYKLKPGMRNIDLVRHLRSGAQATVRIVLHNERLPADLAGKMAKSLQADSMAFHQAFYDENLLAKYGYDTKTLMSLFIPNSYDFYWDATPEDFLEKMKKEHIKFWTTERKTKAEALNLTPVEVYTLASIIKRETNAPQELPTMAGLYLNRLEKGMLLQADPTVVFATGQFDLRRVLKRHLEVDSPYNTYKYTGLPPGPISMASITSIDAVLSPDQHDYIFFCARPDNSGLHDFAKTLSGHNANARRFHAWLNKRGIR